MLFLECPPTAYDVTVEPDKTDLNFYEERHLFEFVIRALSRCLDAQPLPPQLRTSSVAVLLEPLIATSRPHKQQPAEQLQVLADEPPANPGIKRRRVSTQSVAPRAPAPPRLVAVARPHWLAPTPRDVANASAAPRDVANGSAVIGVTTRPREPHADASRAARASAECGEYPRERRLQASQMSTPPVQAPPRAALKVPAKHPSPLSPYFSVPQRASARPAAVEARAPRKEEGHELHPQPAAVARVGAVSTSMDDADANAEALFGACEPLYEKNLARNLFGDGIDEREGDGESTAGKEHDERLLCPQSLIAAHLAASVESPQRKPRHSQRGATRGAASASSLFESSGATALAAVPSRHGVRLSRDDLLTMRAVGQWERRFIVATAGVPSHTLYVIDQVCIGPALGSDPYPTLSCIYAPPLNSDPYPTPTPPSHP